MDIKTKLTIDRSANQVNLNKTTPTLKKRVGVKYVSAINAKTAELQ